MRKYIVGTNTMPVHTVGVKKGETSASVCRAYDVDRIMRERDECHAEIYTGCNLWEESRWC